VAWRSERPRVAPSPGFVVGLLQNARHVYVDGLEECVRMSKHRHAPKKPRLTRAEGLALAGSVVRGVAAGAARALLDWILT
jgi:hypothetical protein